MIATEKWPQAKRLRMFVGLNARAARGAKCATGCIGIMPRKFTTVIFDFGGVITSSPFEAFARFEAEHGLPDGTIRGLNATNPDDNAWARFERAEILPAEFDVQFSREAQAAGHAISRVWRPWNGSPCAGQTSKSAGN